MRYLARFVSICLCLSVIATTATHSSAISRRRQTRNTPASEKKEFILLLAGDKVSVVQLPLIEDGKISVVYQLADVGEGGTDEESTSPSPSSVTSGVDTREFEQMPGTSLRKFGSEQQIVGQQATSTIRPAVASSTEEVEGARNSSLNYDELETTAASEGDGHQEAGSRRPRRSNKDNNNRPTVTNCNGAAGITSGATGGHVNAATANVMESLGRLNVTSAARSGSSQATGGMALPAGESQIRGRRSAAPEEGDKNGKVRFEDFDVHMALGYVFVADSAGRIHRFRLSHFGEGQQSFDYATTPKSASHQTVSDNLGDIFHHRRDQNGVAENSISASGLDENGTIYDGGVDADDAGASNDDANKVNSGGSGAVTHEQSGRLHPTSGNEANLVKGGASAAEANHAAVVAHRQQLGGNFSHPAKARIIWSRIRHIGLPSAVAAHSQRAQNQELLVHQQSATSATGGALAQNQNRNSATSSMNDGIDNDGNHRVAASYNRAGQLEGGDGATVTSPTSKRNLTTSKLSSTSTLLDHDESENEESFNATFLMTNDCEPNGEASWRTEIAVDWINNVLFVLDKCRLLVVDFNGRNELVLIDNFEKSNRPSDIKVDPQNGFLFWIQVGTFQNTIYRLDMNSVTEKLLLADGFSNVANLVGPPPNSNRDLLSSLVARNANSQPVALTSSHYAHPIIIDLPRHAQLFIIDHKHSKIYVPLVPVALEHGANHNKTQRDAQETEVSSSVSESGLTHLNYTSTLVDLSQNSDIGYVEDCNSTNYNSSLPQIRGYKLDGTDRGSLDPKSYLFDLNGIVDMTLDAEQKLFYWLTNNGQVLLEEIPTDKDPQLAEHPLSGESYIKLLHFDNLHNQPKPLKPKYNLKNLIRSVSATANSLYPSRPPRLVDNGPINSPSSPDPNYNESRLARNAPYIILGITALVVLSIYLIYALVFQQLTRDSRDGSIDGESSIDGTSQVGSPGSFISPSQTISKWIANKPSTSRSTAASTFNRDSSADAHDRRDSFDVDSANYNESNAIDEHYRESQQQSSLFNLETSCLVNFSGWPTNLHDLSNKLYVPVEILQDEALSSINRISIDQLEIERKRPPLGVGHFGTVLQGTITCNVEETTVSMRKRSQLDSSTIASLAMIQHRQRSQIPSSSSSGHGSSSISSEFITANSCSADATNGDYLTPKSNCHSTVDSDYLDGNQVISTKPDSYSNYNNNNMSGNEFEVKRTAESTRFNVAIKKLKDNASAEEKRDFLQEAKLLANFDHPNIVHLIGICLDRGSTLIVMELMLGGDLIRYMQENTPRIVGPESLDQEDLLNICLDIVNGCCYLEELNYIHRDLAARNCLVTSRNKEERVVKLADFGLARDIFKDSYYKKLDDTAMPLKWMAIESLQDQKFTIMSDVWSFGIVMWEVMSYCQEKPYGNMEPLFLLNHLTSGGRLRKPDRCTDEIYKLMNECWQRDPAKRPTFKDCRLTLIEIKNRMSHPVCPIII